jgi:hypothetical protein
MNQDQLEFDTQGPNLKDAVSKYKFSNNVIAKYTKH